MTDAPKGQHVPSRPLRLGAGRHIDGYQLVGRLGVGWEGTVYKAIETATGSIRALKFFRYESAATYRHVIQIARTFERLRDTGAVARYYHVGQYHRGPHQALLYLVFECIEGSTLQQAIPRAGAWTSSMEEDRALRIVAALTAKIGAVHNLGLALGDFEDGNNVLLARNDNPVFCDFDAGEVRRPNRNFRGDLEALHSIVAALADLKPWSTRLYAVDRSLSVSLAGSIGRTTIHQISHDASKLVSTAAHPTIAAGT